MSYDMGSVADELAEVLVGRRIVSAEAVPAKGWDGAYLLLTLDNGTQVEVQDTSDCCAYGEVSSFLLNPDSVDHVITSVTDRDDYTEFFVLADMVQVLKLDTSWSEGSGYYSYGLNIKLRDKS